MSGADWRDDDEGLDGLLRGLGTPEAATPVASAGDILARAAALRPVPVPTGLAGWKLAATLTLAVGGGFAAGLWFADRPEAELAQNEGSPAQAAEVRAGTGGAQGPERDAPGSSAGGGTPEVAPTAEAPRRSRRGSGGPMASTAPTATPPQEPAPGGASASCPEPTPDAPSFEDLSALLASGPMAPDPEGPPEAPGPQALPVPAERTERAPREDLPDDEDEARVAQAAKPLRLGGRVGVGPMLAPSTSAGLQASGALLRSPEPDDDRGWVVGADVGAGMFSGRMGANWTFEVGGELSRAWRIGRTEVDLGWTAGARAVVPTHRGDPQVPAPVVEDLAALDRPAIFPATGPQIGVILGDPASSRLSLVVKGQVTPTDDGLSPWVSLTVGGALSDLRVGHAAL